MRLLVKNVVAGTCLALGVAAAQAAPMVLHDSWVRAGVSDLYGTLGSNSNTPPGILFDPTGTTNYGNNDFLTPGTPFEGFYLTSDAANWGSNNASPVSLSYGINSPWTLTQLSATQVTAASKTTDGILSITHEYTLQRIGTRSQISIKTTITNLSAAPVTNLKALRTLDPDPDVNNYNVYDTINTLPAPTQACAEGTNSDETICLIAASTAYAPQAGVSSGWSTDPAAYLAGLNDGNGDYTIGLAFDIGTLAPGASVVLKYIYVLSDTLTGTGLTNPTTASAPIPTLNPLALALLALTLAGGAALGLRRKARQR